MAVKHKKTSTVADGADTDLIRPSDWNDDHTIEDNTVDDNAVKAHNTTKITVPTNLISGQLTDGSNADLLHSHSPASDHGALTGLSDDDHSQYLKTKADGGTAGEVPTHDHSAAAEAGTVAHSDLTGVTSDQHHAQLHAASHSDGGTDELTTENQATAASASQGLLGDGAGGWSLTDLATQAELDTHAGAADPHTVYRLESADHSHQSTGLQAGQLDHGAALTGLSDDDHTQYVLGAGTRAQDAAFFTERADHVNTPAAGKAEFWAKNDTPNTPQFTDDAGNDRALIWSGGAFHDGFSDFVSNEHIDHTSVTLTAGTGLSGGGDISASRSFDIDLNELTTETTIASGDFLAMVDITDSGSGKITFANLEATLNHDNLAGFASNEHFTEASIDHGNITGLGDDDHTIYTLLAGRSGGQTLQGGTAASENLTFDSTAHATKGNVIIDSGSRLMVGTTVTSGTSAGDFVCTEVNLLDGSGSDTVPALNMLTTAGNGYVRVLGPANSLADTATFDLGTNDRLGFLYIIDETGTDAAIYFLGGSSNTTTEVSDPSGVFSPTASTSSSTNIYWDGGGSNYELENNTGSTHTYRMFMFGL